MADNKSMLRKILGMAGNVAEAASHAHTAADLASGLFQRDKDSSSTSGPQSRASGLYGSLGLGDERQFQKILNAFMASYGESAEKTKVKEGALRPLKAGKDAHDVLVAFLNAHYCGTDFWSRLRAKRELDAFRLLVVKIDAEANKNGSEKTETTTTSKDDDGNTTKTVHEITKDVLGEVKPNAVNFLRRIVSLIDEGAKAYLKDNETALATATLAERQTIYNAALEAGHQRVIDLFRATGVPHVAQEGETDWLHTAEQIATRAPGLGRVVTDVLAGEAERVMNTEKQESGLKRLLRKL